MFYPRSVDIIKNVLHLWMKGSPFQHVYDGISCYLLLLNHWKINWNLTWIEHPRVMVLGIDIISWSF